MKAFALVCVSLCLALGMLKLFLFVEGTKYFSFKLYCSFSVHNLYHLVFNSLSLKLTFEFRKPRRILLNAKTLLSLNATFSQSVLS